MFIPTIRFVKGAIKPAFTLIVLIIFLNAPAPPPAHAATLTVTTFADELNANGQCSLREAITNANNDNQSGSTDCLAGSGDDVINLPAGTYTLTLTGSDENSNATGDLDIASNISLVGEDGFTTIIDGNAADRVIHIHSGVVNLTSLTIQNGDPTGITGPGSNQKKRGGGIWNEGGSTVTIERCNVINNTGRGGGGIHNTVTAGTMNVNNSAVANNIATSNSGGIHNQATLHINSSTISGNSATGTDSTGGGISTGNDGTPTITIMNSTIANNSVTSATSAGGGIYRAVGTVNIQNSIIADNTSAGTGPDCNGSIVSQDYNLIENTAGCLISGTTTNNITGSDPLLAALADNGGETSTLALGAASLAVEHIPNGSSGCVSGTSTDQRGGVRADGSTRGGTACEIGAYEFDSAFTPTAVNFQGISAADNGNVTILLLTAVVMFIISVGALRKKA